MKTHLGVLCMIVSAACNLARAADVSQPNGCGSGWSVYLVPDSIPVAHCNFKGACDEHDGCYSKCETSTADQCEYRRCQSGGDLFNNAVCLTDPKFHALWDGAMQRKADCDRRLELKIRADNPQQAVCAAFAIVYRKAVQAFGKSVFAGFQTAAQLTQTPEEYQQAIRDFFRYGTEEQFQDLVNKEEQGELDVDFQRDLKYSKVQGLRNQ